MEELIAQLLRQRSAAAIQAANAQHQAVLSQLAKPMTEREAYAQLDASREAERVQRMKDAGMTQGQIQRAQREPMKQMGGLIGTPEPGWLGEHGLNQYGEPLPSSKPQVAAGDGSDTLPARGLDAPPENISSADANMYHQLFRGGHQSASPPNYKVDHGSSDPRAFAPDPYPGIGPRPYYVEPMDMVSPESIQRDDDVSQTGWLPADFNGMSHAAAAALIADQLRTHRIRQMGEASPDYLQTLPQY